MINKSPSGTIFAAEKNRPDCVRLDGSLGFRNKNLLNLLLNFIPGCRASQKFS
jgi:hypothetical protein